MMYNFDKCPYCGSKLFSKIGTDNPNVKYVLTTVDLSKNPPSFNPTNGMPVDAYGCANCKAVILRNESIKFVPNK